MSVKAIFRTMGLGFIFLWFFGGGIGHFTSTEFFLSIMPPWLPFHLPIVYLTGIIEVLLACLIWMPQFRPYAGWGLIALTLAVTPANIYMWQNPQLFPDVTPLMLDLRLVIQVLLLLLIWWSTRPEPELT